MALYNLKTEELDQNEEQFNPEKDWKRMSWMKRMKRLNLTPRTIRVGLNKRGSEIAVKFRGI